MLFFIFGGFWGSGPNQKREEKGRFLVGFLVRSESKRRFLEVRKSSSSFEIRNSKSKILLSLQGIKSKKSNTPRRLFILLLFFLLSLILLYFIMYCNIIVLLKLLKHLE
ncbi:hypothetical protein RND71_022490 [Anisodus tanguticus]|uniref:Uncharacterized protein n=1 Tax=Anisodus tanguticus TaxID=243964 RepID=A0AAE1RSK2_9SOLA|nr:hypothetical protein RND71_022490 [Anisodus tanguticus]